MEKLKGLERERLKSLERERLKGWLKDWLMEKYFDLNWG